MAIASVGTLGSVQSKTANQASLVLTTSATLEAANVGVILIAVDNNAAVDGDEGAVTGVVDSAGNTWSKLGEFTNAQTGAQLGATISVWMVKATTQLTSGGTITASFNNTASRDASAATAWEYTVGANKTLGVEGTNATLANDAADPGSMNVTTANISCLRIRASAGENNNTTTNWTKTAAFTSNFDANGTTGGGAATNMQVRGEWLISTSTGQASDPTQASADWASIYIALKEVAVFTPDVTAWRWYEDDVSEAGSTALGSGNNENLTRTFTIGDATAVLRIRIQEDGGAAGAATDDYQLQFSRNGLTYADVNTTSDVYAFNSTFLTDAGATTNRLGAGSGSFVAGKVSEDGLLDNLQLTASNYTELVFPLGFNNDIFADTDTIDFRVLVNGAVMIYTVTPRLIVDGDIGTHPVEVVGYRISNTASDLTGAGQDKALVTSGATTGSWSGQSIGANAAAVASFFTPAGAPGTTGNSTKTITVLLDVTTGNANLRYLAQARRVNSAGVAQSDSVYSAPTTSGATGRYVLELPVTGLGTWNSGDRLRIDIRIRNDTANVGQSATITYETSGVDGPWSNATSTWHYGDTHNLNALSGGDLTCSANTATDGERLARATVSQVLGGSAKTYCEFTVTTVASTFGVGVANRVRPLASGTFAGGDDDFINWYIGTLADVWFNNVQLSSTLALTTGKTGAIALDHANRRIWFKNVTDGGNWNASGTADPAANVGGYDISLMGDVPVYVATAPFDLDTSDSVTVNFDTTFLGTAPTGYTRWDGTALGGTAHVGEARFNGAGALSALARLNQTVQVTYAGAGNLSVAARQNMLASVSFAGAGSFSIDVRQVRPAAATFAGAGALSASLLQAMRAAATFSGAGTLSVDAVKTSAAQSLEATFAGAGNLSVNATLNQQVAAIFTGLGALSVNINARLIANATFAGQGSLSASVTLGEVAFATFSGAGSLSADARQVRPAAATFAGAGNLSVAAQQNHAAAATFAGAGSMSVDARQVRPAAATFAGAGSFSIAVTQVNTVAATFAGAGSLSASLLQTMRAAATFSGAGSLSASTMQAGVHAGAVIFAGAGSLSVSAVLVRPVFATFAGEGLLSVATLQRMQAAATFAGDDSFSISATFVRPAFATFTGTGQLSVALRQNNQAAVIFGGAGSLSINTISAQRIAATFAGAGSLAVEATITGAVNAWSGEARFNGAGSLSANTISAQQAAATFQSAGALSVSATFVRPLFATFIGSGQLSVATLQQQIAAATFNGVGTLSVAVTFVRPVFATFAGAGSLSATAVQVNLGAATFGGTGTLSAQADKLGTQAGEATFAGAGSLSARVTQRNQAAATFQGAGSLSAYASQRQFISASLQGSGSLSAEVSLRGRIAATFAGAGALSASVSRTTPAFATLSGTGSLSVNATVVKGDLAVIFTGLGALSVATSLRMPIEALFDGASSLVVSVTKVHQAEARFDGAGDASWDVQRIGLINAWSGEVRFAGAGRMSVGAVRLHPALPRTDVSVADPRTDVCEADPRADICTAIGRN